MDRGGVARTVMRLVVTRVLSGAATLVLIVVIAFLLLELAPGDAVSLLEDPSLDAAERASLREALGLGEPPLERLRSFFASVLSGDLGVSVSRQRPVAAVLLDALPATLLLTGSALLLAFGAGLLVGTRAAERPGGVAETLVRTVLPAADAMPPFWLGLVAVLVFAWRLDWLPAAHMASPPGVEARWGPPPLDLLAHLVLPVLVLAIPATAPVARHQWAAMRRELGARHVLAARALGLPERRVVWRRALRVALQPAIALVGLGLPALAGGAVVVEVVFSWPGLGRVHHAALLARDVPLALGGLLAIGVAVVAGGLVADLLAAWADPRLRTRGAAGEP